MGALARIDAVSIHASRAGGDEEPDRRRDGTRVSIHASRAGGDGPPCPRAWIPAVSIHASRAGGDADMVDL